MNKIYENLNKPQPEFTLGIFLDLKKAFDCCNLRYSFKKLEYYGFKNVANTWFQNYLVNRTTRLSGRSVPKNTIQYKTVTIPLGEVGKKLTMLTTVLRIRICRSARFWLPGSRFEWQNLNQKLTKKNFLLKPQSELLKKDYKNVLISKR